MLLLRAKGGRMRSWHRGALVTSILSVLSLPCVQPLLPPHAPVRRSTPSSVGINTLAAQCQTPANNPGRSRRLASSMATIQVAGNSPGVASGLSGLWQEGVANMQQARASMSEKVWQARHQLLAGASGRCVAVGMMFPVDTVKTRLQMFGRDCCTPVQWSDALRKPLLRGLPSSLMGQVPNGMLVYGSYEVYKREIHERFPDLSPNQVRLMAALLGDATGSVWLAPFERTKQSVQAGLFTSIRASLRSVISERGILGLYSGFKAQVVRDLAFHAIQLPLYDGIKDAWLAKVHLKRLETETAHAGKALEKRSDLRPIESMACGALAGATSGALTTPLDVLKTRLMTCSVDCAGGSVRTTLANVYFTQGAMGFTAGMPQRALYIACGSAIFWTVFEQTVRVMKARDEAAASEARCVAKKKSFFSR